MKDEDRQRIVNEAKALAGPLVFGAQRGAYAAGYIAGAARENERMAELLKEERNKAIQECITAMLNDQDILFNGSDILEKLESLKSQ